MNDELIKKIKKEYQKGSKYADICSLFNITKNQLVALIHKHKWKRKSNKSKVMKNNKNGKGAEKGNKRAVTTGEYEKIIFNDDEIELYNSIQIDSKKICIEQEYKLLCVREYRILKRINLLQSKEKDMSIEKITKRQFNSKHSNITETMTEATSIITPLQKLEDALTRVQDLKRKCLDSLHKIENDNRRLELDIIRLEMEAAKDDSTNTEDLKDDSFIKALNASTEGVWNDYNEDEG